MAIEPSRREFLQASTGVFALGHAGLNRLAAFSESFAAPLPESSQGNHRLFQADLRDAAWNTFDAAGYAKPVTGICYRTHNVSYFSSYVDRPRPASGMPLGGIDTGALYHGTLGRSGEPHGL